MNKMFNSVKFFFFQLYFTLLMVISGQQMQKLTKETMFTPKRNYKSGVLAVTGKSKINIVLGSLSPKKVKVKFGDHCIITPCNNHYDLVTFKIIKKHHQYTLEIDWDVQNTRVIIWSCYS